MFLNQSLIVAAFLVTIVGQGDKAALIAVPEKRQVAVIFGVLGCCSSASTLFSLFNLGRRAVWCCVDLRVVCARVCYRVVDTRGYLPPRVLGHEVV